MTVTHVHLPGIQLEAQDAALRFFAVCAYQSRYFVPSSAAPVDFV
jgi:hypothetical protein